MKKLLSLMMALLMIFGTVSFAENVETDPLETILSGMTLRDKAAQMMIASFRVWKEVPPEGEPQPEEEPPKVNITELNDEIREMLSRNHFGGILLYAQNIVDAEQTLRLISDYQTANQAGGGLPQIIFTDQEGGNVNRISYGAQGVSNMALGATGDPETAKAMAAVHGEELRVLGIQADFAPVVDVNSNALNPVIGIRSFSDDPQTVAQFGCAFVDGLHEQGIMAALKHFPGHGDTATDSHTGFPLINSTYEELRECELIPFQAAINAGADMVMTAHIQYPLIEKETYISIATGEQVYLPATMSRTILTDILRGKMGFDGVVVTDALDMAAISQNFSLEDTIRLAISAGVDLLIVPPVFDTNLFRLTETYVDTAVKLVESGEIDEKRIDESVLRILKLKQKYGILDLTDFAVTDEKIAAAQAGVGSAAHRETEWKIAEKALTVYKNENDAFPLHVKAGEKTLILFADSCANRAGAGALAQQMLEEKQALPEGAEIIVMKHTRDNDEECIRAATEADHVILVHRVYSLACLNPETNDGFSSGAFDKIIPAVHEAGKTVIVLSCQLPYDATRFPDADAVLLTYWASAMRELPAEGASWSANLPAGLLACFGACPAEGTSPVELPALNDQYLPQEKSAENDTETSISQENKNIPLVSQYWTEGSLAAASLNEYLTAVTDAASPDYIPVKDRIAVFDLDGTLMCETYPFCFEYMVFADYALKHADQMPADVLAVAQEIVDAAGGDKPSGMSTRQAAAGAVAYQGMTMDQLAQIVRDFKDSEAWGFTGLKRGEAYYKPMVELFDALLANDFTVYIVTATERNIVRAVIEGTLDIPPSHVIGTEYGYTATNQGDKTDADYTFQPSDQVVFDGNYYGENAKMSKVDAIVREIGQQPVLAFGNSSGDLAMEIYTITNNPWRSAAYMVLADDEAREYGIAGTAAQKKADYEAQGIGVISMREDFATIYGEDVVKTGEFHQMKEYSDSRVSAVPETEAEAEAETETSMDVQYVLYLGTNDKDTNKPVFTQAEAMDQAKEILVRHFGGYTILEAHGGWIDNDTEYQEYTLVIYLSDTTLDRVHAAADEMIEVFHQSSVLIQENPTRTEFYSIAE